MCMIGHFFGGAAVKNTLQKTAVMRHHRHDVNLIFLLCDLRGFV